MLPWSGWAVDALETATKVRRVLWERSHGQEMSTLLANVPGAPSGSWASSHVPAWRMYAVYFCGAAGRNVGDGAPGIGCKQPELPDNWQAMDDVAWARWFLLLGGFSSANQADDDGWTPLHHAVQATVHWDMGHHVVRGLIPMMGQQWLRAKTQSGRPRGWTALHMICNGSDCQLQRGELCSRLIAAWADVEERAPEGRTAFMMAAGTGVIHQAEALSQAGCNVRATCDLGRMLPIAP